MKILFTRFPLESTLGGAEIQTLALMDGLIERGHAVAFVGSCPVLLEECAKRGIINAELLIGEPPVTKFGALTFVWRKKKMRNRLAAMMQEFGKLDAVVMLSMTEKLLLTDIAIKKNMRVFWVEHDTVGRWLTKNPWLPLLLRQSRDAVTIAVSALSRSIYTSLGWDGRDVEAIPNGIDETRLGKPLKRHRKDGNEPLRLGCIARLSHEKGVDVLIRAMDGLPDNVSLEIIGTGPEATRLRSMAAKNKRISFSEKEPDINDAYARFDALVLPSRGHDPFGLTAGEAMMLGLPVIVTDACGIAGYLTDKEDALIVKADSAPALQEAIQLLRDPATFNRLAKNGPVAASEKFSMKHMVDAYETLFTGNPIPS